MGKLLDVYTYITRNIAEYDRIDYLPEEENFVMYSNQHHETGETYCSICEKHVDLKGSSMCNKCMENCDRIHNERVWLIKRK